MNIILKPDLERFAQSLVERGNYENIEQVIEVAVSLLAQESQSYDDWIEEIKPKLQVGLDQLDRGEKVDGEIVMAQLEEKLNRKRLANN